MNHIIITCFNFVLLTNRACSTITVSNNGDRDS